MWFSFIQRNFGRINIWAWTEYSRIVYIDANAIVMRDISALFLLAPGVTVVVGVCLKLARMAHILYYIFARAGEATKVQTVTTSSCIARAQNYQINNLLPLRQFEIIKLATESRHLVAN